MKALLEADPNEFSFETFYVFFLSLFSLCVSFLALFVDVRSIEADPNLVKEIFQFILSFSFFCVIYPRRKSDSIETQKGFS
jgi:hypothetical protein